MFSLIVFFQLKNLDQPSYDDALTAFQNSFYEASQEGSSQLNKPSFISFPFYIFGWNTNNLIIPECLNELQLSNKEFYIILYFLNFLSNFLIK